MAKQVKNITDQDLTVPDIGIIKSGEIAIVPDDFHNANFKEVIASKNDNVSDDKKLKDSK